MNIAHYAYHPGNGPATIRIEFEKEPLSVILTFMDQVCYEYKNGSNILTLKKGLQ